MNYLKIRIQNKENGSEWVSSRQFVFNKVLTVGGSRADINLQDNACTSLHAVLYVGNTRELMIRSFELLKGICLNGMHVTYAKLQAGTHFEIGNTRIEIIEYLNDGSSPKTPEQNLLLPLFDPR